MRYALIIFFAAASAITALAENPPKETEDFINKTSVSNQFEIDTSKLALEYAKAEDVKKFADQMIADHTKAGEEFKAALQEAKITPPEPGLDLTHNAKYAKLKVFTTEGGFDSSYVSQQLEAHNEAVALFKGYAERGPTPALKSFAENTLPTLEHHLAMVQELSKKHSP